MKTIIIICIILSNNWYINEEYVAPMEKEQINCDWLYHSGQGSEEQNKICENEYIKIEAFDKAWKKQALEARGIYY